MNLKPPAGFFAFGTVYTILLVFACIYVANNVKAVRDRTQNQSLPKV